MTATTTSSATPLDITLRAISGAIGKGDYCAARDHAEEAIARGETHPTLFTARAFWLEREGRDPEALVEFDKAVSLDPQNIALLNAVGLCLTRLHRLDEAIAAFDEAIRINGTFAPSYRRKGAVLEIIGEMNAARAAYRQAIRLDPNDRESLANLSILASRSGQKANASQLAARALQLDPRQPTAQAARALISLIDGKYAEAESAARTILAFPGTIPHTRSVAAGLLGDALDGQNRIPEAFAAYSEEKALLLAQHAPRFRGQMSATEHTQRIADALPSISITPSSPKDGQSGATGHVFILGFYRSGTTLLRRILETHPAVASLEERDFLLRPAAKYLSDVSGLAALATLSDDEIAQERAAYWQGIKASGAVVDGKILVDKQPFNTIKLPLIAKIFPDAKIVFTIRDPRDVVLSCFRSHYAINTAMFDLLTLDGAARFYAAAMTLAEAMRPAIEDRLLLHRYEDTVSDFDQSIARVCEFLGVPMVPGMKSFHALKGGQEISSQSGIQVTRPLHGESAGKWKLYRDQISPVSPALDPWIAHWNYPRD